MTLTQQLYDKALGGEYQSFYVQLFNYYFPYGVFFWFLGFILFGVMHLKTKNFTYAGAFASIYFLIIGSSGLIVNAYSAMAMKYFGLCLGIVLGYYIYRALNK